MTRGIIESAYRFLLGLAVNHLELSVLVQDLQEMGTAKVGTCISYIDCFLHWDYQMPLKKGSRKNCLLHCIISSNLINCFSEIFDV